VWRALAYFGIHIMTYETLDKIADSFIPALAIFALLATAFVSSNSQNWVKIVFFRLTFLSILLGVAYGFMLLDNFYHIWPKLRLDYSTHAAVSLVLVLFLGLLMPKSFLLWATSLVAYYGLMLYQEYHSLTDIVSTVFLIAVAITIIFVPMLVGKKAKKLLHSEKLVAAFPFFLVSKTLGVECAGKT